MSCFSLHSLRPEHKGLDKNISLLLQKKLTQLNVHITYVRCLFLHGVFCRFFSKISYRFITRTILSLRESFAGKTSTAPALLLLTTILTSRTVAIYSNYSKSYLIFNRYFCNTHSEFHEEVIIFHILLLLRLLRVDKKFKSGFIIFSYFSNSVD